MYLVQYVILVTWVKLKNERSMFKYVKLIIVLILIGLLAFATSRVT